ncbi:MAG TPA: PEP-CTERM sorting domain-containing protein [Vicinamibacterales bacterium]
MRKLFLQSVCFLALFWVVGVTRVAADEVTVTSGQAVAQMSGGSFTFTGDGFSLTAGPNGVAGEIFQCEPCAPADRIQFNLSSTSGGHFSSGFPGEFNGVAYPSTNLFGQLNFTSPMEFTSATALHTISAPFTLSGEIEGLPPGSGSGGTPIFIASLSGSGIATAHFTPVGGGLFDAHDITYDFTSPDVSATPEPASLLLLGTGALSLLARRRRI